MLANFILTTVHFIIRPTMSTMVASFQVTVNCVKTGYSAEIDFLTKPFFGGKAHRINGSVYRSGFKKPVLVIKGEWNGVITAKPLSGSEYVFVDVKHYPEVKKVCFFGTLKKKKSLFTRNFFRIFPKKKSLFLGKIFVSKS